MRLSFCSLILLGSSLQIVKAAQKPITVADWVSQKPEQVINPIWAPDGTAFAYTQDDDVFLYTVDQRKAARWFKFDDLHKRAKTGPQRKEFGWQNRRVASQSVQWFPTSKDILVETGGDLFRVHPDGGFDQLTATATAEEAPQLSPNGNAILYRTESNLFVLTLATGKVRQLTKDGSATLLNGQLDWVYPEELDLGTAAWWSPDSKYVAYLQFDVSKEFVYPQADLLGERALSEPQRYPQAGTPNAQVGLGVVSANGGKTRWMKLGDTTTALVARVAWATDGSALWVERLNRVQNELKLLSCDRSSGAVNTVITEQSKTWINLSDNFFALKLKPEFLWTSEESGFRHVYRYSNDGKLLTKITSGDWEVKKIEAIDEAKKTVYYTSAEVSPVENQLYTVGLNGGERRRLTQQEGMHGVKVSPDGKWFVDHYSNMKEPPRTILAGADGGTVAELVAPDTTVWAGFDHLPSEIIKLDGTGNTALYGRLTKPAGYRPGEHFPLVVLVYGGPGAQSVHDVWSGFGLEQVLAQKGYLVWQLDNHGSTGRGHVFEDPIYHELGRQEVADQVLGVKRLIADGLADPARVGITGWSYGGYMTIRSLLLAPDVFKIGVAGAPVTDWHNYDTIYTERYMGLPSQNVAGYKSSSNVEDAGKLQGKLLILHNVQDDNVLFQNTMQFVNALEKADKQYSMQLYPQKSHSVSGDLRKPLYEAMVNFFDENLK